MKSEDIAENSQAVIHFSLNICNVRRTDIGRKQTVSAHPELAQGGTVYKVEYPTIFTTKVS